MQLEAGKKYFRKRGHTGSVRKIIAITDKVYYKVLYGPARKQHPDGCCKSYNFLRWADGVFEGDDYHRLEGAVLHKTFVMQSTSGKPLFRCSKKRCDFYIRKGYVDKIDEDTYRFNNDQTEEKLNRLYKGQFTEFFMAVKNDQCCVCGKDHNLTRHHVVPQRYKKNLPLETRNRLSNILFVCTACHKVYEDQQFVSDSVDPHVWKDHFISTMNPKFIPSGWDIISIR